VYTVSRGHRDRYLESGRRLFGQSASLFFLYRMTVIFPRHHKVDSY